MRDLDVVGPPTRIFFDFGVQRGARIPSCRRDIEVVFSSFHTDGEALTWERSQSGH